MVVQLACLQQPGQSYIDYFSAWNKCVFTGIEIGIGIEIELPGSIVYSIEITIENRDSHKACIHPGSSS
jgi:hypothetical protein